MPWTSYMILVFHTGWPDFLICFGHLQLCVFYGMQSLGFGNSLLHSRWLQNRPTTGHSWACQPYWWCHWENVFKKGKNGAQQFGETGGKGKKVWEITIKTPRERRRKGKTYSKSQSRCSHAAHEDHSEKQLSLCRLHRTTPEKLLQLLEDPTWKQVPKDLWTVEISPCWSHSWRTEACIKHTCCSKRKVWAGKKW